MAPLLKLAMLLVLFASGSAFRLQPHSSQGTAGRDGNRRVAREKATAAAALAAALLTAGIAAPPALAARTVAEIPASGLVFKDTLNVEAFADPKVEGVTLYLSDFTRPITERLQKDFFSDPSSASVTCARTGPMRLADNIERGPKGEDVFSEAKSLLFKSIKVKRVYDADTNTVVYVSYSDKLIKSDDDNKSRFKSSLCALHVE
ncbi:unnamed protein product [Heterosigma akashiwo]|uniref:Photosystem II reaction center Psb28 protein n=1 Tax=Heterosigma akashiwo TaxID=2829 RepID=A0A6V1LIM7_HETAK